MSHRRAGLHGLQQQRKQKEGFQKAGEQLAAQQLELMKTQLEVFKANLESFAIKYKQDIKKDPVFRSHFQKLCSHVGVDPLASNKGFWSSLLGFGDFYYELGVQIVEICITTRELNGGLIDLQELKSRLEQRRGHHAQSISV